VSDDRSRLINDNTRERFSAGPCMIICYRQSRYYRSKMFLKRESHTERNEDYIISYEMCCE